MERSLVLQQTACPLWTAYAIVSSLLATEHACSQQFNKGASMGAKAELGIYLTVVTGHGDNTGLSYATFLTIVFAKEKNPYRHQYNID